MAYLDLGHAYATDMSSSPVYETAPVQTTANLSALEWSVVALARRDRVSSLGEPSRIATAMGRLFGTGNNPRLADPRLEALRRLAVLAWHHGYVVPKSELKKFLAAGFTLDQFETMLRSISSERLTRDRKYS